MKAPTLELRPCIKLGTLLMALSAGCFALLSTGCRKDTPGPGNAAIPLKVAYLGLTCEAPIFVAYHKGFFTEEGLEVELTKTDWEGLREGLGMGRFDANHTLIMYLLKPIEAGMDVKITGGVHTGCLRLQVGTKSGVVSAKELKGKKIGVPTHKGSPPHLFASRVLVAAGIDPSDEKNEVTWMPFPPDVLGKAVSDGRVDAIATSDPVGMMLMDKGIVRTIADQAVDPPYNDEYCCACVVSGKLAKNNPIAAAKVTRAILKAARWVEENPTAAAEMAVEKKYTPASKEINAQALSKLKYMPGVSRCRVSIDLAAKEMKRAGLLKPLTDPDELTRRAWLDLDGVTDEWVKGLKVQTVKGGGRPQPLAPGMFAALCEGRQLNYGCCGVD